MIRLNRLTDYAVVTLTQLGRSPGSTRTAAWLARETGVPLPTVSKLLKTLAQGGLVVSHRGAAGGYSLARSPAAISMAEIITVMEGPIALTACVGQEGECGVESLCPMRGNWDRVNTAIRGALDSVSLAEMACGPISFLPADAEARSRGEESPVRARA